MVIVEIYTAGESANNNRKLQYICLVQQSVGSVVFFNRTNNITETALNVTSVRWCWLVE